MSVSVVDVTRPPITTIARGRWISASGEVAKRNGKFAAIRRLRLIDEADQIAPTHIAEHGRETLAVFADHLDRAVLDDDLGDLRELHRSAIGNHHRDPRRIGGGCALAILVANDQRRAHLSFQNDAEIATIDPDAQRLLHLLGVSGRAARPCRERPWPKISHSGVAQREDRTRRLPDPRRDIAREPVERRDVLAEHLHHDSPRAPMIISCTRMSIGWVKP